jgi:hypothetical protein
VQDGALHRPGPVAVDQDDQGVPVAAAVGVGADDRVLVAVDVAGDVALLGQDRPHPVGPAGARDAALHQGQRGPLGLGGLPRGAQVGHPGQQRQRGRGADAGGVVDQRLADDLLDVAAGNPAPPPGAQDLADDQFGVQRAAHRQQLARVAQHPVEDREDLVRGRRSVPRGIPGGTAAAAGTHVTSFSDPAPVLVQDGAGRPKWDGAQPGTVLHP